jgi:hypothetical protein
MGLGNSFIPANSALQVQQQALSESDQASQVWSDSPGAWGSNLRGLAAAVG